jgi:ABC-type antimicrobial peptide transport system permease subunit
MGGLREVARQIDPNLPLTDVSTQIEQVEQRFAQEKLFAQAYTLFGGLALLLASIGLFGLMSYNVSRRTNEIGIRMALGAQGPRVVAMVLGSGARLVIIGIALGLPAAWAASRSVGSMLFGLTPTDPVTVAGAAIALAAAAQMAAYLPARRASRVDPLVALRHE